MTNTSVTEYHIPDPYLTEILDEIDEMIKENDEDYEDMRSLGWEPRTFYVDSVGVQVEMKK